jgi:hypothetical protein
MTSLLVPVPFVHPISMLLTPVVNVAGATGETLPVVVFTV